MILREIMTGDVVSVAPETPAKEIAEILIGHRISGVPVVEEGRVVGVVSEKDLVFKEREAEHHSLLAMIFSPPDPQIARKHAARTAREAMTAPPLTITSGQSVTEAATLLTDYDVNRLPVVDSGQLVGIVTRSDLVRAFIRSGEEIERDSRDSVLV